MFLKHTNNSEQLRLLRKGNSFPDIQSLLPRWRILGRIYTRCRFCPKRVLLFKIDFFLVLISNLIHGVTICTRSGIPVNNTFQNTTVTLLCNVKRSLCLNLLRQDQFHGNCKCSVILVIYFFFLQGLQEGR